MQRKLNFGKFSITIEPDLELEPELPSSVWVDLQVILEFV